MTPLLTLFMTIAPVPANTSPNVPRKSGTCFLMEGSNIARSGDWNRSLLARVTMTVAVTTPIVHSLTPVVRRKYTPIVADHLYLAKNYANHGRFSRYLIAVQCPGPFVPRRVGSKPMQQVPLLRSESRRVSLFLSLNKAAS